MAGRVVLHCDTTMPYNDIMRNSPNAPALDPINNRVFSLYCLALSQAEPDLPASTKSAAAWARREMFSLEKMVAR